LSVSTKLLDDAGKQRFGANLTRLKVQ